MKIEARLFTTRGIWQADMAYVFASNDLLTISFGAERAGDTAQLVNGTAFDILRIGEDGTVDVPARLLGNGMLKITVRAFIGERCVDEWRVDPLAIVVASDTITATPWTVSVEERLEDLENAVFGQSSPLFE